MSRAEMDRLRDQLRRAIHGDAWHGPSVLEAARRLDARRGWARVAPSAHSACELLLHTAAWLDIVRRRFLGEVVTPGVEQDWPPPPPPGESGWAACIERVRTAHASLDSALSEADDRRLDDIVPGQRLTSYAMLHGVVQHSIYHAGQLTLIERALE